MAIYIKIPSITGDCSDKDHKDWIIADFIQWSAGRKITSSTSTSGDRESSIAAISDLIIQKHMDRATADLFIEACCGRGLEIEIHMTKTGNGNGSDTYMAYILKNAVISGYEMGVKSSSRHRPIEELKISFVGLDMKYTTYDEDNFPLAPIAVGFDTSTNRKV